MKADARGVTSIDFDAMAVNEKLLLDPGVPGNGALAGNNVLRFAVVGFRARVVIFTGAATSSGVINPILQESVDGTTWTTLATLTQQGATDKQVWQGTITKPYLQLNGNIGGTSSTLKCTAVIFY